jgi:NAD(P)-dependent dehydrogenase (short-subunit alcohol dehydrogenase family)
MRSVGRLEDRIVVVTGAGRGIGRALAEGLADEGARVVVSARTLADLEEVATGIRDRGGRATTVVGDALDPGGARAPVRAALAEHGAVDVLVNNVGGRHGDDGDPWNEHDDLFDELLTLNLTSAWWTTNAALPQMRRQGRGRVVNIGSGLSDRAGASIAYTAAKHGLVGLTRSLATSVGRHGITVNCVCPGYTLTSGLDWHVVGTRMGVDAAEARRRVEGETALGRTLAAGELTGTVALLASDEGAGITGQVLHVDGGWRL